VKMTSLKASKADLDRRATQALRLILANGWRSDALAADTAAEVLTMDGATEAEASAAVRRVMPQFSIMDAN